MSRESERATAVAGFWPLRPGGVIAELLIGLDENRGIALDVATVLKDS